MGIAGSSTLPNILSSDSEKDTKAFGFKFMTAAYENWNTGYNGETRWGRQTRFDYNRAFAMGRQPMQEYKDILDLDGEDSVIQLIYEPLPIAIPFLMRMDDRYMRREEKISCNAIDPFTTEKKKVAKDNAKFKLKERQKIEELQNQAGVQLEEYGENEPESEEELEVEFGYNYKEREEVIMQELINIVFYENDMSGVIKARILDDLRCCGYAGTKTYIDANGRIKIRFIQPENLVTSYCKWNDFRDWQYLGEVYCESIANIRLKYPNKISEEQLFNLSKSYVGKMGNPDEFSYGWDFAYTTALARPYDSFMVEIIELEVKTLYNLKYKTGTDRFGKETIDPIKRIKDPENSIQSNAYEVTYTGVMITTPGAGADDDSADDPLHFVLEWGLSKNMVKPQDNLQEVMPSYAVYMYGNQRMVNKPMVETMIPSIKKMQLIDLKQQAIIAAAMPDGYDVDISTMSDVDLGNGQGVLSPFALYNIKKQTGIGFYKRIEDSGMGERREPITANNVPFSGKLEQLRMEWNAEYDTLMKITGDNNLNSGNITNQAVSQEVVKQAQQTGESSSNYIYNSYLNILKKTAKLSQLRGWDILVFGKKENRYYDGYRQALGTNKVEYIKKEATDDFERTNFDVQIKAIIDDNAQIRLQQQIDKALDNQQIEPNDAIDVEEAAQNDIKYASYILAARINKRKREAIAQATLNNKQNTEAATAAAEAKGKADVDTLNAKAKNEMDIEKEKAKNLQELEILKGVNTIKGEIAKALLSQPGATIDSLPPIVLDGMGIVDQSEKQTMVAAIHQQQQEAEAEQQAQMAQAQQQQEQMMAEQQMQQQGMPQEEQVAA